MKQDEEMKAVRIRIDSEVRLCSHTKKVYNYDER